MLGTRTSLQASRFLFCSAWWDMLGSEVSITPQLQPRLYLVGREAWHGILSPLSITGDANQSRASLGSCTQKGADALGSWRKQVVMKAVMCLDLAMNKLGRKYQQQKKGDLRDTRNLNSSWSKVSITHSLLKHRSWRPSFLSFWSSCYTHTTRYITVTL